MVAVTYKGKRIGIPARNVSMFSTGLIFRTRNTKNLFFGNVPRGNFDLTSYFVFFPFLVLWLDEYKNVVDLRIARPFEAKISSKKPFHSIVEIPFNRKNGKILGFFVGKEKFKKKSTLDKP